MSRCSVCRTVLRQNMALALGSIAALALPVLAGWLPLWVAVTLHEGSTLLVALNSLRLLHVRPPQDPAAPRVVLLDCRRYKCHSIQGRNAADH